MVVWLVGAIEGGGILELKLIIDSTFFFAFSSSISF